MNRFWISGVVGVLLASRVSGATLGTAGSYSEFILGNSTRSNVDAQGKVAVGGNASFTNFTVGSQLPSYTDSLIVGGTLSASSASVKGNIFTGGNATYTGPTVNGNFNSNANLTLGSWGSVNGNIRYSGTFNQSNTTVSGSKTGGVSTVLPVDFASESTYLKNLSLAQYLGTDAAPTFQWSQMFVTAGAGSNYFNVTGAQLQSSSGGFHISAPAGATVVINVSGSGFSIPNTGFDLSGGITSDHLLFNFYQATALTLQGGLKGTLLAPLAALTTSSGGIDGNLIAGSLTGSIQSRMYDSGSGPSDYFAGSLRSVPEPVSLLILASGSVPLVLWSRRRRSRSSTECA